MRNKALAQQFGRAIRQLRQHAQLSQEELAERCQLHRTYIGLIERGERTVTIETAAKLAHVLGLSMTQLFAYVETVSEILPTFPDSSAEKPL